MSLPGQIESVLFVASKPLTAQRIAKALQMPEAEVTGALLQLRERYSLSAGVVLYQNNDEWQLVTNPANRALAEQFMKAESSGDLTRPQLEALTVIAYRGPITRPELEQIRGVNCSLILRNLMLRGLVQESEENEMLPRYQVTMDYLRLVGVASVLDLPDYQTLHAHEYITAALVADGTGQTVLS